MVKRDVKGTVITVVVSFFVALLVYILIGSAVNAWFIRIYDAFPEDFVCYPSDPEKKLDCNINNNAPLTLPYINPFYSVLVVVDSENGSFAYFIGLGDKKCNFTDWQLDLGRIDSGSSKSFSFFLHINDSNMTFRIEVAYTFVIQLVVASKTYLVQSIGNNNYTISGA